MDGRLSPRSVTMENVFSSIMDGILFSYFTIKSGARIRAFSSIIVFSFALPTSGLLSRELVVARVTDLSVGKTGACNNLRNHPEKIQGDDQEYKCVRYSVDIAPTALGSLGFRRSANFLFLG